MNFNCFRSCLGYDKAEKMKNNKLKLNEKQKMIADIYKVSILSENQLEIDDSNDISQDQIPSYNLI
jgi:hypothetical protein